MSEPTLTDFLLARIAEDESDARGERACQDAWSRERASGGGGIVITPWMIRASPARMLAECDAKRRIMGEHRAADFDGQFCGVCSPLGERFARYPCDTLRILALPYADHPDYREEWKA